MWTSGVVDTLEAVAGDPVAVTHSVLVDVEVTVARLTAAGGAVSSLGVAEVPVTAEVTLRSCK